MVHRWHTAPVPPTIVELTDEASTRSLSDILGAVVGARTARDEPLYAALALCAGANAVLTPEELDWVRALRDAFDAQMVRVLHVRRATPWGRDDALRDEYAGAYAALGLGHLDAPAAGFGVRGYMARLLTYSQCLQEARFAAPTFELLLRAHAPPPRAYTGTDCSGHARSTAEVHHTRPWGDQLGKSETDDVILVFAR